jgi:hypothetical protein
VSSSFLREIKNFIYGIIPQLDVKGVEYSAFQRKSSKITRVEEKPAK